MPQHCKVCERLDRGALDLRLARQQCNVAEMAREIGVSEATVRRHRASHVPSFLKVYGASPELPSKGELHGELMRLYVKSLDALAVAEAGTLEGINDDGTERRRISHTAIAAHVREARTLLGDISTLAADAGSQDEAPTGMARGELAQRILARLDRPTAHELEQRVEHEYAVECIDPSADERPLALASPEPSPTRGGQAVEGGGTLPDQMALDAATAPKTLPGDISLLPGIQAHPRLAEVVKAHQATLAPDDPTSQATPAVLAAPNPRYPGSPAATREERAAAGYPDIPITLDDIKSLPPEIARLIAEHRAADPTNSSPQASETPPE